MDITNDLAEKEREITAQEQALEVLEGALTGFEHKITLSRIKRDEEALEIKKMQLEIDVLMPSYRKAKNNISRMKRDHAKLMREYFKERDMAKGMR